MSDRIKSLVQAVRSTLSSVFSKSASGFKAGAKATSESGMFSKTTFNRLVVLSLIGGAVYAISTHPPIKRIPRGEVAVRINQLTGGTDQVRDGSLIVVPGLHELRLFKLQDQLYKPTRSSRADGEAPFQSVEGLSLGVDLSIRYALDPDKVSNLSRSLPENINAEIVEPAVQGVIYKAFTVYTVREIFSSKRADIQKQIEAELKPRLAADGIILRGVTMGKVDLPADYKRGMEKLLAEELESEKMRYTLELKDKQVKQTALEAEAAKIQREKAAEAAGAEQIIAAKAQEEAMKHVLPFKEKQIEQRRFEAEAEKMARIKTSEGAAQARVIEAQGEADSRRKLADADAYRQDLVGKVASVQMEREGALLSKHPLLIQKTMADKLSDKVSVIIAPPPTDGSFIGATLLGSGRNNRQGMQKVSTEAETETANENKESQ
ncbi:SPFH domain-containing protein [Undibacterium sp. TS12]|uniref:SPFH domain-containing protein n=1 Tax=Undibacterium sp. TS12 TaxID=2908202 RepID=UPI001F4CB374|nr:SPFH domain-containing protein [Undibacterium sp. TS12]MCH8617599.1 SPFH domain-containing protein [Undibacterium sp. TS12]